jgi:hypothetical protein
MKVFTYILAAGTVAAAAFVGWPLVTIGLSDTVSYRKLFSSDLVADPWPGNVHVFNGNLPSRTPVCSIIGERTIRSRNQTAHFVNRAGEAIPAVVAALGFFVPAGSAEAAAGPSIERIDYELTLDFTEFSARLPASGRLSGDCSTEVNDLLRQGRRLCTIDAVYAFQPGDGRPADRADRSFAVSFSQDCLYLEPPSGQSADIPFLPPPVPHWTTRTKLALGWIVDVRPDSALPGQPS